MQGDDHLKKEEIKPEKIHLEKTGWKYYIHRSHTRSGRKG